MTAYPRRLFSLANHSYGKLFNALSRHRPLALIDSIHTAPGAAWRRRLLKVWTGTLKTSDLITVERERFVVSDLSDIRNADRLDRDLEAVVQPACPTPTQLFVSSIIFCFYWENKMLNSTFPVSLTVKNSSF